MDRNSVATWLGPACDDLTDEQLDRLAAESADIDARYPDADEMPQRDAALSAAVQHLLGEVTISEADEAVARASNALATATAARKQIVAMASADKRTRLRRYALDMAAADGRIVTQGHADYCGEYEHATATTDGIASPFCPRCGEDRTGR